MKTSSSLLFFLFFSFSVSAQKEANIWYFGKDNLGLDFNNGDPVVLTDGKLGNTEGSAVISDEEGNLLFYTDGETVWNKNHDTLLNGSNLSGHKSAAQPALIIPQPGSSDKYYIFTTDFLASNGFRYSIVDMDLDNGLGGITTKNVILFSSSTEKITAARHVNNTDIWVIAHERNSDSFYSYRVSNAGIDPVPVISHSGSIHLLPTGYMKTSPQGNRLALALSDTVEIFDFDQSNGVVSDPISILVSGTTYGVEFSPDGSKVYFTFNQWNGSVRQNQVYQIDLAAGEEAEIKNSRISVYNETEMLTISSMQLGPDGKIYVSTFGNHYLDIIETPDHAGIGCNYIDSALYLHGKITRYGLPNFLPSFLKKEFTSEANFEDDSTYFLIANTDNISSALWDFGDPSASSNTSDQLNPSHYYDNPGVYDVNLTVTYLNWVSRTIQNTVIIDPAPQLYLGSDTSICNGDQLSLNLLANGASYVWNDGSVDLDFAITSADTFWVEATLGECKQKDSIIITYELAPTPFLGEDTSLCIGDTLRLNAFQNNSSFLWNDGTIDSFLDVFSSGSYYVEATNKCGTGSADVNISFISCCDPFIPNLLTANNDGHNEKLVISCIEDRGWKLELSNRWGEIVYSDNDYQNNFDASEFEEGIYFYSLSKEGRDAYKGCIQIVK